MERVSLSEGADLLLWFHAFASKDRGPPGFTGKLAVGVEQGGVETWWQADFGGQSTAAFLPGRPTDADTELLLTAEEADAMLRGDPNLKLAKERLRGRRELLDQFLKRYVLTQNFLSLRAPGPAKNGQR